MAVSSLTRVSVGFLAAAALQLGGGVWWMSALSSQVKDTAIDVEALRHWQDRNGERIVIDIAKLQQAVADMKDKR